jgi:TolB-like protein
MKRLFFTRSTPLLAPLLALLAAFVGFWLSPAQAQANASTKFVVAIGQFTVVDLSGKAPAQLGAALASEFEAPLFRTGRFRLAARNSALENALREIALAQAGLTQDNIKPLRASGVNIYLDGTVRVDNDKLRISVKAYSLETLEIQYADIQSGRNQDDFPGLVEQFVAGMAKAFPLQGAIIDQKNSDEFYINIGTNLGLIGGETGFIYQITKLAGGQEFNKKIGEFVVQQTDINVNLAIIKITRADVVVQKDMSVSIPLAGQPLLAPVINNSSSTSTLQNPNPNSQLASLTVSSQYPATVFINGANWGVAPQTVKLPAGNYSVALVLKDYADYEYEVREVSINLGQSDNKSVRPDVRLTIGTLQLTATPSDATITVNGSVLSRSDYNKALRRSEGSYSIEVSANGYITSRETVQLRAGSNERRSFSLEKLARKPGAGVWVALGGNDNALGISEQPYASLERALREASSLGEAITLREGSYNLPTNGLRLGDGVVLRGEGRVNLRCQGDNGLITEGNVQLSSISLGNCKIGISVSHGSLGLSNVVLEGNARALLLQNDSSAKLQNSQIRGNGVNSTNAAVKLEGRSTLTVQGGSFENNNNAAILVSDESRLSVSSSSFRNNANQPGKSHIDVNKNAQANISDSSFISATYAITLFDNAVANACRNSYQSTQAPDAKVKGC